MKPDPQTRIRNQKISLGNGVIEIDGREYLARVINLAIEVQEYRAGNGEVCHMETISTRVTISEPRIVRDLFLD